MAQAQMRRLARAIMQKVDSVKILDRLLASLDMSADVLG